MLMWPEVQLIASAAPPPLSTVCGYKKLYFNMQFRINKISKIRHYNTFSKISHYKISHCFRHYLTHAYVQYILMYSHAAVKV